MIPKEIIKIAEERKDCGELKKIGTYEGKDVYSYTYDEPMTIGMPEFYLWDGKHASIVRDDEALNIIDALF